ncbi:MAG: trigger factor, partial [Dehalococcoidia bacterium]|nr:trigger factor [Dehalococcoidia bacterium]
MKVKAERTENSQMVLEVEAEPEEVERSLEQAYHRLVKRAEVPGFRRGKAPRDMLEHYLGRGALLENALDKLVPRLLSQAIEEQGLDVIAQPEIEITKADPVTFKATVPLRPTVKLGSYRELDIAPETVTSSEEEVNRVIEQTRYRQAPWEPVERPIKFGDLVIIDVMGSVEGKPLLDRKDLEFQVQQGLPVPVPGFAEKLEGVEQGQDMEFSISLPSDYGVSELAGKECYFKVRVSEIKEKKLPELNDEFAKSIGQGFETLDALTDNVTSNLRLMSEEGARRRYEEKVIDAVVEGSHVEFPPIFVEQEIDRFIAEQERDLSQNRMSLEDYLRITKKSREEFREELRPVASGQVARSIVVSKVAESEDISVSGEEIDGEVAEMVKGAGEQGEALGKFFQSAEARRSLERMLVTRKTIERLVEIASGGAESTPGIAAATSGDDKATSGE